MRNHTQISDILLECVSCHCPTVFWKYRESEFTLEQISSPMIDKSTRANILAMYFALLCCAPLCCAVLHCAVLCSVVLYCAPLCCATLLCCACCCVVPRCCVVSVVVLCSVVLCCAPLCCIPLCCAPLCYHEKKSFLIYIWIYRGTLLGVFLWRHRWRHHHENIFSCIIWDDLSIFGDKLKLHWVV